MRDPNAFGYAAHRDSGSNVDGRRNPPGIWEEGDGEYPPTQELGHQMGVGESYPIIGGAMRAPQLHSPPPTLISDVLPINQIYNNLTSKTLNIGGNNLWKFPYCRKIEDREDCLALAIGSAFLEYYMMRATPKYNYVKALLQAICFRNTDPSYYNSLRIPNILALAYNNLHQSEKTEFTKYLESVGATGLFPPTAHKMKRVCQKPYLRNSIVTLVKTVASNYREEILPMFSKLVPIYLYKQLENPLEMNPSEHSMCFLQTSQTEIFQIYSESISRTYDFFTYYPQPDQISMNPNALPEKVERVENQSEETEKNNRSNNILTRLSMNSGRAIREAQMPSEALMGTNIGFTTNLNTNHKDSNTNPSIPHIGGDLRDEEKEKLKDTIYYLSELVQALISQNGDYFKNIKKLVEEQSLTIYDYTSITDKIPAFESLISKLKPHLDYFENSGVTKLKTGALKRKLDDYDRESHENKEYLGRIDIRRKFEEIRTLIREKDIRKEERGGNMFNRVNMENNQRGIGGMQEAPIKMQEFGIGQQPIIMQPPIRSQGNQCPFMECGSKIDEGNKIIRLKCRHNICRTCGVKNAKILLNNCGNEPQLLCPWKDCYHNLSDQELMETLQGEGDLYRMFISRRSMGEECSFCGEKKSSSSELVNLHDKHNLCKRCVVNSLRYSTEGRMAKVDPKRSPSECLLFTPCPFRECKEQMSTQPLLQTIFGEEGAMDFLGAEYAKQGLKLKTEPIPHVEEPKLFTLLGICFSCFTTKNFIPKFDGCAHTCVLFCCNKDVCEKKLGRELMRSKSCPKCQGKINQDIINKLSRANIPLPTPPQDIREYQVKNEEERNLVQEKFAEIKKEQKLMEKAEKQAHLEDKGICQLCNLPAEEAPKEAVGEQPKNQDKKYDIVKVHPCNGIYHKVCLVDYLKKLMAEKKSLEDVVCPHSKCKVRISVYLVLGLIGGVTTSVFQFRMISNKFNVFCCPCGKQIEPHEQKEKKITCECKNELCRLCMNAMHKDKCKDPKIIEILKEINSHQGYWGQICPYCRQINGGVLGCSETAFCIACCEEFCRECAAKMTAIRAHGVWFHRPECSVYKPFNPLPEEEAKGEEAKVPEEVKEQNPQINCKLCITLKKICEPPKALLEGGLIPDNELPMIK